MAAAVLQAWHLCASPDLAVLVVPCVAHGWLLGLNGAQKFRPFEFEFARDFHCGDTYSGVLLALQRSLSFPSGNSATEAPAAGDLVISEVMPNPGIINDSTGEFALFIRDAAQGAAWNVPGQLFGYSTIITTSCSGVISSASGSNMLLGNPAMP